MKNITTLFFFSFLLLASCSDTVTDGRFQYKNDYKGTVTENCIPNHNCKTGIDSDAKLQLDEGDDPRSVNPVYTGDKLVFSYEMEFIDDPDFGDDEVLDRVQFEVETSASSFYYKDADLQKAKALFTRVAFSMEQGFYPINKGILEGHKNDNGSWDVFVYFHIVTKGNIPVTVERAVKTTFN